jgi:hypothetical protein
LIESDHRFAVGDRQRCALITQIDQLFQRRLIGADVFLASSAIASLNLIVG